MYQGWIVIEREDGFRDHIWIEYDEQGERKREFMGRGNSGCALAVEWWDRKVGGRITLHPYGEIGYRVFFEATKEAL